MDNILNFSNFNNVCLSGGADGSDLIFGSSAGYAGHQVIHWSFSGNKSSAPEQEIIILNKEQLEFVDPFLYKANEILKRRVPIEKPWIINLLRRNYYQIAWSEKVYAVGRIDDSGIPLGGTAWAVVMAMQNERKPEIYFYDQEKGKWLHWNSKWDEIESPPKPSGVYAGIGTRELNEIGKNAIRKLYTDSPYPIIKDPKIGDIIYLPDLKFGDINISGGWATVRRITKSTDKDYISVSEVGYTGAEWPWQGFLQDIQIPLRIKFNLIEAHLKY